MIYLYIYTIYKMTKRLDSTKEFINKAKERNLEGWFVSKLFDVLFVDFFYTTCILFYVSCKLLKIF